MFFRIKDLEDYCKQLFNEYDLNDFMFHTFLKGTDDQRNILLTAN